ncbi:MAG: cache domain-containing protein, partial [Gammaproteobacteria bacterium]
MKLSIGKKILLFMAAPAVLLVGLVLGYELIVDRAKLLDDAAERGAERAQSYARQLNAHLREIRQAARSVADLMIVSRRWEKDSEDEFYESLLWTVRQYDFINGALILFEPGRFPGRALFGPLVYRRDSGYGWFDVAAIDYPNNAGWYLQMRTQSRELWGAPYRMQDSANWVSTFATPMMLGPELVGAVGLDVKLTALLSVIGVDESEEPLFTVLDRGGQFVYHHRDDLSTVNVEDQTDDDLGHIQ